ncbi:hypothetical protein JW926_11230 [Candidatus Sumerlaeota bacterium]|nr:hypothetical protein [Candidatus Sumerlaeota bacterium]
MHLSPGSFHIFRRFLAFSMVEGPDYAFRIWWFPYALFVKKQSPFFCDMIFWPPGMNLTLQSSCFLKEFIGGLLGGFWRPLVAQNILTILTVAANGTAAYYIGRRLFRLKPLAYLTGIFIAISGSLNQNIPHLNILSAEGFLLYMIFLHDWSRDSHPGNRHIWRLGLSAALSVACFIQNIVFLGLWTLLICIGTLFRRRLTWIHLRILSLAIVIAFMLNLPHIIPNIQTFMEHPEWAKGYFYEQDVRTFRFSLIQFFLPWKNYHPMYPLLSIPVMEKWKIYPVWEPFLGFFVLFAGIYGFWRYRRRVLPWFVPGVFFLLLSLGPGIRLTPHSRSFLPGPFLLVKRIPILNTLRNPSRYILPAQVCLGICAVYGAIGVIDKLRKIPRFRPIRKQIVVYAAGLFALIHLWELSVFPFPSTDPKRCPYYREMRKDPEDVAVLDCPMQTGLQCHMYFVSLHGKRATHGFGGRVWFPDLWKHENPFYMDSFIFKIPPEELPDYVKRLAKRMSEARVKYIVVHKWLYASKDACMGIRRFLENESLWRRQNYYANVHCVFEDDDHIIYIAVKNAD